MPCLKVKNRYMVLCDETLQYMGVCKNSVFIMFYRNLMPHYL